MNDIKTSKNEKFLRIFQAFALIKDSKVLEHLDDAQIIRMLLYCDDKGWMHYKFDGIKILLVACAYNLEKFDPKTQHQIPAESKGKIMFVPFVASRTKDKFTLKELLSGYLAEHPETEKIIFYKDDATQPTTYNLKGETSGKTERVST